MQHQLTRHIIDLLRQPFRRICYGKRPSLDAFRRPRSPGAAPGKQHCMKPTRFFFVFLALTLSLTAVQESKGAAIEHYVAQASAEQSKTTNGWSAVTGTSIAGTNFTVGERYLVLVWGEHDSNNNAVQSGIRVIHGGTAFTESQTIEETDRTGAAYKTPYFWFTVWTAANENLEVEYYNSDATATYTARVEDVTLLAINAEGLIAAEDLQYDIQTGGGTLTTTPTSKASFTWTPANNGDTWWIMAYAQADIIDVGNDYFLARIDVDGTDRSIEQIEGEDATDTPLYGLGWVTTLTDTSHTIAVQLSERPFRKKSTVE